MARNHGSCRVTRKMYEQGIGGSREGGVPGARPPMGPNSFVFAYIFTKKCPRRRSTPPLTVARPPMGNPGSATAGRTISINIKIINGDVLVNETVWIPINCSLST